MPSYDGTGSDRLDGPLDHLLRPQLPWRVGGELTECGLAAAGKQIITRRDLEARVSRIGQRRAMFTACLTCWETAARWPSWEHDPIAAVGREAEHLRYAYPGRREERRARFVAELRALAALVEAHRDEFDDYLAGLDDTVSLAERRQQRRDRAER